MFQSAPSVSDDAKVKTPTVFELSVVLPCLNEKATVAVCVEKAVAALKNAGIDGEAKNVTRTSEVPVR